VARSVALHQGADSNEVPPLEYEVIRPRSLNLDDPNPHNHWVWHNQVSESQRRNGNNDYFAATAGRNTNVDNILPPLDLFGGNPNVALTQGDVQAKIDNRKSFGESEVYLQSRVSRLLTDIQNNRPGATYANPQELAKLQKQLKTTLEVASVQGVAIEMRPANNWG
jgi:hypothetical protein